MIKTENVSINGLSFVRTYSDMDMRIHKIGTSEIYDEAVDVIGHSYVYEETTEPREIPSATESEMREALTILGVDVP
jgi:hypothetical protein